MTMCTHADSPLSHPDYYRLLRAQMEFEGGLIVQRLNWLMASQSFLFTAYAIVLNAPQQPAWPALSAGQHIVFHLIPLVAVVACVLIYCGVLAGVLAQRNLRRLLQQRLPPEAAAQLPPIQGAARTHRLGLAAPLGLSPVFAAVWLYLFVHGLS
jgi:hypothetical protein